MDRQIAVNIINIGKMYIDEVNINMRTGEVIARGVKTIDKKETSDLNIDIQSFSAPANNLVEILKNLHRCSS